MSRCVGVSVISGATTRRLLLVDDQPPSSVVLVAFALVDAVFLHSMGIGGEKGRYGC